MGEPQLLVGLGNPGPVYAKTRHNLGFMVADLLAARAGASFKAHKKSGAEVATGRHAGRLAERHAGRLTERHAGRHAGRLTERHAGRLTGRPIILGKPRSFMNESGRQVAALAKFYSVPPAGLVVIHDDLDIDFGRIRLKFGGGVAGHNGLRSVASALNTNDFHRVRVGIGRPPGRKDPAAFVLENFTAAERPEVPVICEQAADATELLIKLGLEAAQNQVHAWG